MVKVGSNKRIGSYRLVLNPSYIAVFKIKGVEMIHLKNIAVGAYRPDLYNYITTVKILKTYLRD